MKMLKISAKKLNSVSNESILCKLLSGQHFNLQIFFANTNSKKTLYSQQICVFYKILYFLL